MKKEILEMLINNRDKYISGEEISKTFSVSRTAIWKSISNLKSEGYEIESISGKGYRLTKFTEKLNANEMSLLIKSDRHKYNFVCLEKVDSTNTYLKRLANEGLEEWTIVFSEEQDMGRGRLGRTWESGLGENIIMSILLKPQIYPHQAPKITQIAAAAVYLTIKKLYDVDIKIKWPNDIIYSGKKICGILTEMTGELNAINYIILGIGINVNSDKFSSEIQEIATSLKQINNSNSVIDRKEIIKLFLENFEKLYYDFMEKNSAYESLEICRKNSAIINEIVDIVRGGIAKQVKVVGINEEGELLVENEFGKEEIVRSGEVSIRRNKTYI